MEERIRADIAALLPDGGEGSVWRVTVESGITTPAGRVAKYPVRVAARVGGRRVRLWYTADGELAKSRVS